MVMSYQGKRVEQVHVPTTVPVKNYMTKRLVVFTPDQPMEEVIAILIKKRISGAPVVNDEGELVGIISEGDCLKEVVSGKYTNSMTLAGLVKEHMTTDVQTLDPDTPILEAAQKFLEMKIRRFPVVENGKLIGLFSQSDVLRAANDLKSENWSS